MDRSGEWEAALKDGRTVLVRHLRLGDGSLMAEFYAALSDRDKYYFWPYELDAEHAYRIAAEAEAEGRLTLVAVEGAEPGERLLGYAFVTWRPPRSTPSLGICIRPEAQSVGLGGHLMTRLLDCCRSEGLQKVTLTVHKDNERAQRLYRSRGFEVVGEQVNCAQNVMQWRMEVSL